MFIEPLLGMDYPNKELKIMKRTERFIMAGDQKKLAFDMDFLACKIIHVRL